MFSWISLIEDAPGLALVAPMAAAALAILKWSISRHDAQFARRKEFLQNWKHPDSLDDLSIEVLVRQLTGTYLPALVVRRVCRRGSTEIARTLQDLATIWPLVQWNSRTGTASWKKIAGSHRIRVVKGLILSLAYFVAGTLGSTALIVVVLTKPEAIIGFASAAWGLVLIAFASTALWAADAWGTAVKHKDALLARANSDEDPSDFPGA